MVSSYFFCYNYPFLKDNDMCNNIWTYREEFRGYYVNTVESLAKRLNGVNTDAKV